MPANEQTWYDVRRMHRIFALAGIGMLIATIWVLWKDHNREWKPYQVGAVKVDTQMIRWRELQYATDTALATHEAKSVQLLLAEAKFIDPALLEDFSAAVAKFRDDMKAIGHEPSVLFDDSTANDLRTRIDAQRTLAVAAEEKYDLSEDATRAADAAHRKYMEERAAAKGEDNDNLKAATESAAKARENAEAAHTAFENAANEAKNAREGIVARLMRVVDDLRRQEDLASQRRKFRNAELDAAKANVDIAVRDNDKKLSEKQANVDAVSKDVDSLTKLAQTLNSGRIAMQNVVGRMTIDQAKAVKDFEAANADLTALQKAYEDRKETYFTNSFPFLGKKILTLPILSAFNSPQKIENLWSNGLEQNVNFKMVRRFDRCTTCHQMMQKSIPKQPNDPAYIAEQDIVFWLTPPAAEAEVDPNATAIQRLEKTYGMRLADEGLLKYDDVTVSLVLPESAAAKAEVDPATSLVTPMLPEAIRTHVAAYTPDDVEPPEYKILPGLLVGDVIERIGDGDINEPEKVAARLLSAVGDKQPIRLVIRRGLPNPYTTHPRLDLFVGDGSPHRMGTFACTICHEGQGSATEFKWASHTPNDGPTNPEQSSQWAQQYGWFDNHHWIYPMYPKRFAESACLKCHHDVTELEPSEKFPEPPAPKVVHGYHLIRKYGCYGCHEVNGYDGPDKRIGPDLRLEPNFFAAALQLGHLMPPRATELEQRLASAEGLFKDMHDMDTANLDEAARKQHEAKAADLESTIAELRKQVAVLKQAMELAPQVAARNFDQSLRNEFRRLFEVDAAGEPGKLGRAFTDEMQKVAGVLKESEAAGTIRKVGPTLRYTKSKLDPVFVYDWTNDPQNFRPTTKMPKFFNLHDHLEGEPNGSATAKRLEPVEIHGIVSYLNHTSQTFVPLTPPEGIDKSPVEEMRKRGKVLFETRGCLACHNHHDFPRALEFRGADEIVQGPELSALAEKFDEKRNPKGREWLYSWIKEPTKYNVRTLMPNLILDPITDKIPEGEPDADGKQNFKTVVSDPVADLVEYLTDPAHLSGAKAADDGDDEAEKPVAHDHRAWKPVAQASEPVDPKALRELVQQYLAESFRQSQLDEFYDKGIPGVMYPEIKVAERDLIVPEGQQPTDEQRLQYIGRRTIAKYGCYGCHDVPGFEDAKPIGTGLADWGRKDPAKLAFEHITHYIEHGHGGVGHGAASHGDHANSAHGSGTANGSGVGAVDGHAAKHDQHGMASADEGVPEFYDRALHHQNRIGFIWQKLREPRSYDYMKTENKKYNDRLRMPKFPFNAEEREAVITFVLGLVAEPPGEKYLYKPSQKQHAILAGKQVLETYNCGGCHVLTGEQWNLAISKDTFGPQSKPKTYPFMLHEFMPSQEASSATPDRQGLMKASISGLPALSPEDALPLVRDAEDEDLDDETKYAPRSLTYAFDLYKPTILAGEPFQTGMQSLAVPGAKVTSRHPSLGGFLAKYLAPVVLKLERLSNSKAQGNEVYAWLPPPLMGEGEKVQTDWLHDFLLEPYKIRPATFMRMPKFNMSNEDASKLVGYFAAIDNAEYPYEFSERRQSSMMHTKEMQYEESLAKAGEAGEKRTRFDDAMKIVTNGNYCVKCHLVGDYQPPGSPRALAPNLARVYSRLRPDYLHRWIANPKMILPYTAMPVNIPYDPDKPMMGGVDQKLYHGVSTEQLDGLVDLLMNYDEFAKERTRVSPLVEAQVVPLPAQAEDDKAAANDAAPSAGEVGAKSDKNSAE